MKQHLLAPVVPELGGIVTVADVAGVAGAGEPQIVICMGYGFEFVRQHNEKAVLASMATDAVVTLGRKDDKGRISTQDVPAWTLRPWIDSTAKAAAA